MSDSNNSGSIIVTISLISLTAVLAYLQQSTPLTTQRPEPPDYLAQSHQNGGQSVLARLWQDPLSAIKSGETNSISPKGMRNQIAELKSEGYEVEAMPIFIEGFPYSEDVEVRLRVRYAIQTALLRNSYEPADRSHLGVLSLCWPSGNFFRTNQELPALGNKHDPTLSKLLVPFEWFTKGGERSSEKKALLVLWLKEEEFADYPMRRLLMLAAELNQRCGGPRIPFKILGPRSSNTLKAMSNDKVSTLGVNFFEAQELLSAFSICSPEATAPDALLYGEAFRDKQPRQVVKERFAQNSQIKRFDSMIATDDGLAKALISELELRGVEAGSKSQDKIAIISESDTLYGRSFALCFGAAFATAGGAEDAFVNELNRLFTAQRPFPPNVIQFSYLRGLDGSTDRKALAAQQEKKEPRTSELSGSLQNLIINKAEGDSQLDYANRLAQMLEDTITAGGHGGAKLRAIGIFGSDIYDKLILLQALRPRFPDLIFFTTDLDARYSDPQLLPYTRNLIVASSYGLKTGGLSESGLIPFRDNYQTAVYQACTRLIKNDQSNVNPGTNVYEIGRTRAIAYPLTKQTRGWHLLIVGVCVGLVGIPLFMPVQALYRVLQELPGLRKLLPISGRNNSPTCQGSIQQGFEELAAAARSWRGRTTAIGIALITAFSLVAYYASCSPNGEPFYFFEGVSIWPTELIRLVSIVASAVFVVGAWHLHKRHRLRLWRDYFANEDLQEFFEFVRRAEERKAGPSRITSNEPETGLFRRAFLFLKRLWNRRLAISLNGWKTPTMSPAANLVRFLASRGSPITAGIPSVVVDTHQLFRDYVVRGLWRNRLLRCVPIAVLYIVLACALMAHFGFPVPPYRGVWSLWTDRIVLFFSICSFSFIAFYTVDSVRLTQVFVSKLAEGDTNWSSDILLKTAHQREMDPRHLDGYLDVMFTADKTHEVSRLAFCPFIVLCLMLVARAQFFDHWSWPPTLTGIFIANAAIIFICFFSIRRTSQIVREQAIAKYEHLQAAFVGEKHEWPKLDQKGNTQRDLNHPSGIAHACSANYGEKIRLTLDEIKAVSIGAYSPLLRDNSIMAALIPSGGIGLLAILQRLFFAN